MISLEPYSLLGHKILQKVGRCCLANQIVGNAQIKNEYNYESIIITVSITLI